MPDARVTVTVTPVLGASGPSAQPLASLVTIEQTRILLDCGWTEAFTEATLEPLKAVAGTLDAVVISSSALECAGGIPYLYAKLGCTAPCYMTLPVHRLAPLALLDALAGRLSEDSSFSTFNVEDVASSFALKEFGGRAVQVRFGEDAMVKGVSLTAVNAGHTLGACVWRLQRSAETVVYAPTFNHRSEAHLSKAALAAHFRAPSAFITLANPGADLLTSPAAAGAAGAGKESASVNKELGDTCLSTLRGGGSVLFPVDTAGRALEVLLRLEAALSPESIRAAPGPAPSFEPRDGYPIFLLSNVSLSVVEHAKTLLEFMNDRLAKEFSESRVSPFAFDRDGASGDGDDKRKKKDPGRAPVRVVQSLDPVLESVKAGTPCCVLASFPSMDTGFARQLLEKWATVPNHCILFTSKAGASAGSLAGQLLAPQPPSSLTIESTVSVPITGPELRKWREAQDEERRRVARAAAAARARAEERQELAETVVVAPVPQPAVEVSAAAVTAAGQRAGEAAAAPSAAPSAAPGAPSTSLAQPVLYPSGPRVDEQGYALDEDLARDCEYVDEVAEAVMGPLVEEEGADGVFGPMAVIPAAAPVPQAVHSNDMDDDEDTDEAGGDGEDEAPPGAMDEDAPPGLEGAGKKNKSKTNVAGAAKADRSAAAVPSSSTAVVLAVGRPAPGRKRRRGLTPGAAGQALARGPTTVRFPMFGRDLGSDARAVSTEYGLSIEPSEFVTLGTDGWQDDEGQGQGRRGPRGQRDQRPGAAGPVPAPKLSPTSSAALQALEKLLPGLAPALAGAGTSAIAGAQPGLNGQAGPSAASVLAAVVAASGLVRPGETAPTKRVKNSVTVTLRARVKYIPLEGRVDGASLLHVLEEVQPLKVVLLKAPSQAALDALSSSLQKVIPRGVSCPGLGIPVDVSSGVAEVSLLIRDALWSSLTFARLAIPTQAGAVGGASTSTMEVAFVHAAVETSGGAAVLTLPAGMPPGHLPVLLRPGGPARLADVRKRLAKAGIDSEAAGEGALVTKSGILITRAAAAADAAKTGGAAPMFELEGPAGPEYFQVRKVLYELFTFM